MSLAIRLPVLVMMKLRLSLLKLAKKFSGLFPQILRMFSSSLLVAAVLAVARQHMVLLSNSRVLVEALAVAAVVLLLVQLHHLLKVIKF